MNLPCSNNLDISKLAAVFNNTSATYKFYWLLAIVESAELGKTTIAKQELFARMVTNAWYTVHYFRVLFGKQDLIQDTARQIMVWENLAREISKDKLLDVLMTTENKKTINSLWHFNKNVPHWFLSPWIKRHNREIDSLFRKRIYLESHSLVNNCPYSLEEQAITLNQDWKDYITINAGILKGFIYWNLAAFLQVRNPNIPDIPGKLVKPPFRGSLTQQRKYYWDIVLRELGTLDCIFTSTRIGVGNYALDHFVPYAFVSHDLIWNLVPIDPIFNSIKSDRLPTIELHFDKFFAIQQQAIEVMNAINPNNKFFQDFIGVDPTAETVTSINYLKYRELMQPLLTIASLNGFQTLTQ